MQWLEKNGEFHSLTSRLLGFQDFALQRAEIMFTVWKNLWFRGKSAKHDFCCGIQATSWFASSIKCIPHHLRMNSTVIIRLESILFHLHYPCCQLSKVGWYHLALVTLFPVYQCCWYRHTTLQPCIAPPCHHVAECWVCGWGKCRRISAEIIFFVLLSK